MPSVKKTWFSDKTGLNLLLPILGIMLGIFLLFMVWDMARRLDSTTREGFASKLGRNRNSKSSNNSKKQPKTLNSSKLDKLKNGDYDANAELRDYGMDGTGEDEDTEEDDEKYDELGTKMGENALKRIIAKRGKVDTFKDVVGNIDRIRPGAFNFRSIGNTIKRYNENFNNQLNHAREKNKNNNFEATMAQGSVLFKEFKKLFAFSEMF